MSIQGGQQQYLEQGMTDTLSIRLFDEDGGDVTLSGGQTVEVESPGGTVLLSDTGAGVTISGNTATLSQAWTSTTYQRDNGYKATWTLTDGVTTFTRLQYFHIVRRRFRSTLKDSDLTSIHPYLNNQNQAADFSQYKAEAWEEITNICAAKIPPSRRGTRPVTTATYEGPGWGVDDYPGNFFFPSSFRQAHLWLTLAWFFSHNSFGNQDQNELRAESYRERGINSLDLALSKVSFDRDDDGTVDGFEREFAFNSMRLDR